MKCKHHESLMRLIIMMVDVYEKKFLVNITKYWCYIINHHRWVRVQENLLCQIEYSVHNSISTATYSRLCLQLFVGGIMSYLRYFSLLVHSVLCFCFCFSSSCCQFLWIVLFSNVYLRNHRSFKYELCTSISQFSYQNPVFVDNNTT
jgi:hypothetical protein